MLIACSLGLTNATDAMPAIVPVNPASDDALGGHDYPWYDAEARSVKSLNLKPGAEPSSDGRENVPLAKLKAVQNKNTTTSTTTGGGGVGGGGAVSGGAEVAGTLSSILIGLLIVGVVAALVVTFLRLESADKENTATSGRSRKQSIEQLPFDLETSDGDFPIGCRICVPTWRFKTGDYLAV